MHEGSTNPRLKQELHSATDLALRAREVAAQSLGKAMSTLVVQERRLWLSLAERSDVDKVSFLDGLVSQAWLFGDTVEDCAQQFSAVQKQTEAIQHILLRRDAPLRRRASPSLLVAVGALLCPPELLRPVLNRRPARRASCRSAAPPVFQLAPISSREAIKRPWHRQTRKCGKLLDLRRWRGQRHSFPRRRAGGESFILFCRWLKGQRYPHCQRKSKFPFLRVFRLTGWQCATHCLLTLARDPSCQRPRDCGWGTAGPPPRTSSQSQQGLREFCEDESERRAFCTIQPYSHSLHHCGYVDCAVGATCTASGGVACAAQPVSLAHAHNSTRLRDSVHQATSQVQRRSRDCVGSSERSCLARGDCCPPGKDAIEPVPPAEMRQGFYSPYFIVPKMVVVFDQSWIATPEPGPAQAPVQDVDAQAHDQMHTAPGLVCSDRPEGCLLSCFDPSATQTVPTVCVRGSGMAVQGPPLWALPVPPCLHEGRGGRPCPVMGSGHQDPQLSRAWPARENSCAITGTWCFGTSASWGFGSTGKRASSPLRRESLFLVWSRLGEYDGTPHGRAHPISAELPEFLQRQDCGSAETVSEAPGAYGIRSHAARIASYETTSALVALPSPEVGMAPRCTSGEYHTGVSPLLQPLDRPCLSTGRVPLEQVSRHVVVTTDASSTGWGATCNGQAASGLWTGPRLLWHINCLELLAVRLALRQFRPLLLGKHVLVRADNTAAVSYINRMGGIRSHRMSQLARHLLLWSHTRLKSLRAVHIPGELNRAADALSRQLTFPGEWRLHPETIRLIWSQFGESQVDLFASRESSHCQLYFSLTEGSLGTDTLAHSWPRALCKYAFPPVSLLAQTLCKVREDEEQVLLVAPFWPTRTWFPKLILLATAPPWPIPLRKDLLSQGLGTIWHLRPDLWNLHVWLLDGTRQTWVVSHRRW